MKSKNHKGMVLLKTPITRKIASWNMMPLDAKIERYGVTWYRVKDGMGGRGDREDWIADVPEVCVSIHDYHWNGDDFGANHGSFNGAIVVEMKNGIEGAERSLAELKAKLASKIIGLNALRESVKLATLPKPKRGRKP